MEWDNLRYFLTLARSGTLTATSRRLNVQHSTVARRVARLEIELGEPLFIRSQDGYSLNNAGRRLLSQVEQIDTAVSRIRPQSAAAGIAGIVRVGSTEGYGTFFIAPTLQRLGKLYPTLELDLIVEPRMIKLPRNEADIVITIDRPERGPYIIQKLFDYELILFAAPSYLAEAGKPTRPVDLRGHRFVTYVDDIYPAKGVPTISEVQHAGPALLRSSSLHAQIAMTRSGAGIALLPTFAVDTSDGFVPLLSEQVRVRRSYWMMAPHELKSVARVRCVWDEIAADARQIRQKGAVSARAWNVTR